MHALRALGAQYRNGVPTKEGGTGAGTGSTPDHVVQVDGDTMVGSGQEVEQDLGRSHKVALASLRASLSSVLVVTHELLAEKDQPEVQYVQYVPLP